ncbi:TetR/AcrR family transcriptional regulator [Kutzneria buriramensis]|uniref:AcrR family transcriptional regulator n=1 Tax=Kutzneria buriramensis TaxID=1045776 RepID=A0A3E0I9Q4_9PSEU|nr:TetR/AcrR family transcriptional regulator [Kutzneria buriramensis]REH55369.1 AcrR family transcriptional regulator [Kutzneria buriramensis]
MAEEDRRVRRTRRTLHEALIELVLERGYERLTVQDILDRADVGRSTFYAHFRDKEALLLASFDDIRDRLREDIDAAPDRPATLLFEHAYQHQRVYRALCGRQGGSLVIQHVHGLIGDALREQLAVDGVPAEVVAEFHTSGILGLLVWWIDHDFCHGPEWLAGVYRRLAPSTMAS